MAGVTAAAQRRLHANKYARRGHRHRRSTYTKAARQRPTARNQRRQIMANARAVGKLTHRVNSLKVWSDWALTNNTQLSTGTWFVQPLNNYGDWASWGRANVNTNEAKKTFWQSAKIYFGLYMIDNLPTVINIFIVTPAHESANRDPFVSGPQVYRDYVQSEDGCNIYLNRDVFRVISQKSILLSNVNPTVITTQPTIAGNPNTCWARYSTSYKTHFPVRQALGDMDAGGVYIPRTWRSKLIDSEPYYRRFYFMVQVSGTGAGCSFFWNQNCECYNSD